MKKNNQSGQVLLITIMLLATVLTVVLSTSFKSTTDTQVTKLEAESQKALAAAEAAIEAQLKSQASTTMLSSLGDQYSNFSGGASLSTATSNVFTTPLLQKDEQYTLYLQTYNPATKSFAADGKNENITLCYTSQTTDKPVIEITLIKSNGVNKIISQPTAENILSGNNIVTADNCTDNASFSYGITVDGTKIGTDSKLMLVRMLNTSGKLYFKRTSVFPLQGKTVSSEARSNTGVSKAVTLFQSYPQIPSEFFVSSF